MVDAGNSVPRECRCIGCFLAVGSRGSVAPAPRPGGGGPRPPPPPAPPRPRRPPPPAAAAPLDAPPAAAPDLPAEARVTGVIGHRQTLSLSCGARAAADWAAFFGVGLDEIEFLDRLPVSDDPDVGFVGDVRGTWGQIPPEA